MSLDFHCDLDENWLMCKIHRSARNVNNVKNVKIFMMQIITMA